MGIYISFVAHFPYFDYGDEYRIREDDGRLTSRYYNNLSLLDQMIKRIYQSLKEQGRLERTIFVIAGDHGQREAAEVGGWVFWHGGILGEVNFFLKLSDLAPMNKGRETDVSHSEVEH